MTSSHQITVSIARNCKCDAILEIVSTGERLRSIQNRAYSVSIKKNNKKNIHKFIFHNINDGDR